jgi:protein subunit release factor B
MGETRGARFSFSAIPGLVSKPIRREGRRMHPWQPNEVEEVFCRSSGPGGQHVNKVSTAVTLRHLPTGLSVRVSTSRSQARNRAEAIHLLAAKLESAATAARQLRLAEVSKNRRRKAKRSRTTKRRLVESKRRRGEMKQLRKKVV